MERALFISPVTVFRSLSLFSPQAREPWIINEKLVISIYAKGMCFKYKRMRKTLF